MKNLRKQKSPTHSTLLRVPRLVLLATMLSTQAFATPVPATEYAYIPNSNSRTLSVINTRTGALETTLSPQALDNTLSGYIYTAAARPGSNEAWFGQYYNNNRLGVIDSSNNSLKAVIEGTGGSVAITFSPDGSRAYVSDYNNSRLHVVNADTKQVIESENTGCRTISSAMKPDGSLLYFLCENGSAHSYDTQSGNIASIANTPHGIYYSLAYDPTGDGALYIASVLETSGLYKIDLSDNTISPITVDNIENSQRNSVAVRRSGGTLYFGGSTGQLHIIDTDNPHNQSTLDLGALTDGATSIGGLGISSNDTAMYAVMTNGTTHVIDLATNQVTKTIAAAPGTSLYMIWGDFLGNVQASATPSENEAPAASAVTASGTPRVGLQLSGQYTYADAEDDPEGDSTFRWIRNSINTGTSGGTNVASSQNYIVTADDEGAYLYFCVTPVAQSGSTTGSETCSTSTSQVQPASLNGACGAANGQTFSTTPSINLCSSGTASSVFSASGLYSWTCEGTNGGSESTCSANWANTGNNGTGTVDGPAPQDNNNWIIDTANFSSTLPAPAPEGANFPQGLLSLSLIAGEPGSSATVTIQYTQPVPAGAVYMKYGKSPEGFNCNGPACDQDHWYQMPAGQAVFSQDRMSVTLTIQDGGVGDNDLTPNGVIQDPGGPVVLTSSGDITSIPTLSEWGMIILSSLMALGAIFTLRRKVA